MGLIVSEKQKQLAFLALIFLIFIFALAIRFIQIENRPVHHDEGVNGFFIHELLTKRHLSVFTTTFSRPYTFLYGLVRWKNRQY